MDANDLSQLALKPDHKLRPIWTCCSISSEHIIYLDTSHELFAKAVYEFLNAVAEPVSRPQGGLHQYKLTENSLYAAAAANVGEDEIVTYLDRFSKNKLQEATEAFIRTCSQKFGKGRLVLKDGKFHVETKSPEILQTLLQDPHIAEARDTTEAAPQQTHLSGNIYDSDDDEEDEIGWISFPIKPNTAALVKQQAREQGYPLLEEYCDYRNDQNVPNIPNMHLKFQPGKKLRPYQEAALGRMFRKGRARSGVIVLPCGAGKTLTGIAAAQTLRKPVLCLCNKAVSVNQWKAEFLNWTTISEDNIAVFTSTEKTKIQYPCVLVTTYSMMTHQGRRTVEAQSALDTILSHNWGLLLLDEVQTAPAAVFRNVTSLVKAHCRLGLSATLVREDNLIDDLGFLVGPSFTRLAPWI